jgi:hypothetical protein
MNATISGPNLLTEQFTGVAMRAPLREQINDFILAAKNTAVRTSAAILLTGVVVIPEKDIMPFNKWDEIPVEFSFGKQYIASSYSNTEARLSSVTIPNKRILLGKKVSLREACAHAGQVLEEAEARRQAERANDVALYFGSSAEYDDDL